MSIDPSINRASIVKLVPQSLVLEVSMLSQLCVLLATIWFLTLARAPIGLAAYTGVRINQSYNAEHSIQQYRPWILNQWAFSTT